MRKPCLSGLIMLLLAAMAFLSGCSTLTLEERIIKEGEEQTERLAREQKNYEYLKSRINYVCTPIIIPHYRNHHLNIASYKLAASCKRASQAMINYISDKEKEDNIRNVLTKVFMEPDNYIELRPTRVGEFPRPDGSVQKMTPAEFAGHLMKVINKIETAAADVMLKEQQKSQYDAQLLKFSVLELWQMEMAKDYISFVSVMTPEERNLYQKELQDYQLWKNIVSGDAAIRRLTQLNKARYFTTIIQEVDTAAAVAAAVLIEIERFRRICERKHAHKQGWEKTLAIAAEAARVSPYVLKATEQSLYASKILAYMNDEWALSWYDVEKDLMDN